MDSNQKDQDILSTPDAQYVRQSWDEVRRIVRENRIDEFMRVPSDLRLYREYCFKLKREYGSVMSFVLKERLGWEESEMEAEENGERFGDESELTISSNMSDDQLMT